MAGNNSIQLLRGTASALSKSSSLSAGQPCYVTDLHTLVVSQKYPINASTRLLTSATSTGAEEIHFLNVRFTSSKSEIIVPFRATGAAAGTNKVQGNATWSSFSDFRSKGYLVNNVGNDGNIYIPVTDSTGAVSGFKGVIVNPDSDSYTGVYTNGATTTGIAPNIFNVFETI